MSTTESILAELLEELIPLGEGSGIFVKQLRNGSIYTCKCPVCGTFHGGFRDEQEARQNLKCRRCYGSEIERKKKDIEKVDEPKKQKDIFQHPLNKPATMEALEDDEDFKDVALPPQEVNPGQAVDLSGAIWNDQAKLGRAFSWLARIRVGPKFGSRPIGWYQTAMAQAIDLINLFCKSYGCDPRYVRYRKPYIFAWHPKTEKWKVVCTRYQAEEAAEKRDARDIRRYGEALEDDFDAKDVYPQPDRIAYNIFDGSEYYPVSLKGFIGRQGYKLEQMSGDDWAVLGMSFHHAATNYTPWATIQNRLDSGESLNGYLWDKDHGSTRRWGRKVKMFRTGTVESLDDDDFKEILGDSLPGAVTKQTCLDADHGQKFWEKGTGRAFRVIGRCKTWKTRPNEYRLPVKFGLFQTFHISERNAEKFTTIRPSNATSW